MFDACTLPPLADHRSVVTLAPLAPPTNVTGEFNAAEPGPLMLAKRPVGTVAVAGGGVSVGAGDEVAVAVAAGCGVAVAAAPVEVAVATAVAVSVALAESA